MGTVKGNLTLFPLNGFKTSTYTLIGTVFSVAMFRINRKGNDLAPHGTVVQRDQVSYHKQQG